MARPRIETQEAFEARILGLMPGQWAKRVKRRFDGIAKRAGMREANGFLLDRGDEFGAFVIPLYASDGDVCAVAEKLAAQAMDAGDLTTAKGGAIFRASGIEGMRESLNIFCRRHGIEPPGEDIEIRAAISRMTDALWWRRRLRAVHARNIEAAAIGLGFVHAGKGARPYCSDVSLHRRQGQKARNAAGLKATMAINEDGEAYTLAALAEKSVANPKIRRGELMTRIRGFEEIAQGLGHLAEFWTLTCPSRMHARHHDAGAENGAYDGTSPREAQRYLGRVWARFRAALHRRGVGMYGFRIAEPHHDGTPHWHLMLFFDPAWPGVAKRAALPRLRAIFRRYALADSPDERGARTYRAKFIAIDAARGTAAGYIAKYVAKNIDGYMVGEDLFGNPAIESSARVEAWASTWGIRQFQQFGGPPVGVWRELRRIEVEAAAKAGGVVMEAKAAIEAKNWRRYTEVMGGPVMPRKLQPLAVARVATYQKTGAALLGRRGRYGEVGLEVVGIVTRGVWAFVASLRRVWEIATRRAGNVVRYCCGSGDGGGVHASGIAGAGAVGGAEDAPKNGQVGLSPLGLVSITVRGGGDAQDAGRVEGVANGPARGSAGAGSDGGSYRKARIGSRQAEGEAGAGR